ncbi:hypothetical protein C0033_16400 [Clostridium sp. chh4-2]|nr:hypothetical protein C0033_16400 [Clostridium sp. chh4-2]
MFNMDISEGRRESRCLNEKNGKEKEKVIFPIEPNLSEISQSHVQFIEEIKEKIKSQRISAV